MTQFHRAARWPAALALTMMTNTLQEVCQSGTWVEVPDIGAFNH
jgi:hypothetical protein